MAQSDPRAVLVADALEHLHHNSGERGQVVVAEQPVELNLWALQHPRSMGHKERLALTRKAQRNPKGIKHWRRLGWKKGGDGMRTPMSKAELKRLYSSRKGKVCGGFRGSMTSHYVFWVKDRREAKLIPFGKARAKIVNRMIASSQQELTNRLAGQLRGKTNSGAKTEDLMFDAALKSGVHREWFTRQRIINTYVANTRQKREMLLPGLRARYHVAPGR